MKAKVSVIVPVYNSEKYLVACIESILAQTYTDLEVLLIDDGSSDHSGSICDRYADDVRVRIFHRQNVGVSRTRNFGIAQMTGAYLLFVDSDDTIEPDMIEEMMKDIQRTQADCAVCGLFHDGTAGSRVFPEKQTERITDGEGAVKEVLINYIATAGPVCKLFARKLVKKDPFPEDLTVGEDAAAVVGMLLPAQKVIFHTVPFYHYNHREDSLTSSLFSERDLDMVKAYAGIQKRLEGTNLEKEAEFRQIWAHFYVYDKMVRAGRGKRGSDYGMAGWLRKHIAAILQNPYVGKKRKIAACALFCSRSAYKRIIMRRVT